jgi:hypothetical protein
MKSNPKTDFLNGLTKKEQSHVIMKPVSNPGIMSHTVPCANALSGHHDLL